MKSTAATADEYFTSLPATRREPLLAVRRVILANLDKRLIECMQYGVVAYCVPHSVWPHGHHTRPELPLMYMGLSSQKNDMVVYMLCLYRNDPMRAWFERTWNATGKKLKLDISSAGCCIRFKKLDDLALDVIAATIRRVTVKKYLANHIAHLRQIGKGLERRTQRASSARPTTGTRRPRLSKPIERRDSKRKA
ncbi:MAG TPA: DUF1801 domain-containing protein [Phycisphaerales bacterium]|nr:DUF1801 domain-containing protein [Phycisphaerales bacterium]